MSEAGRELIWLAREQEEEEMAELIKTRSPATETRVLVGIIVSLLVFSRRLLFHLKTRVQSARSSGCDEKKDCDAHSCCWNACLSDH